MTSSLAATFLLGLAGSAHCLVMCGPLVAAVQPKDAMGVLKMHGARLTVYATIGALVGAAGSTASGAGVGRWVAFAAAAALVAQAWVAWRGRTGRSVLGRSTTTLVTRLSAALRERGWLGPTTWGVINGLLPCGMVYGAATAAAGLATPAAGALAMLAFGLGTVPALVLVGAPVAVARQWVTRRAPWLTPAVLVLLAVLLTMRGLQSSPAPDGVAASADHSHHAHMGQASNPQR